MINGIGSKNTNKIVEAYFGTKGVCGYRNISKNMKKKKSKKD